MTQRCPKCERKTRTCEKRKRINARNYWITVCVVCKTPLDLEEIQVASKVEEEATENNSRFKGWV